MKQSCLVKLSKHFLHKRSFFQNHDSSFFHDLINWDLRVWLLYFLESYSLIKTSTNKFVSVIDRRSTTTWMMLGRLKLVGTITMWTASKSGCQWKTHAQSAKVLFCLIKWSRNESKLLIVVSVYYLNSCIYLYIFGDKSSKWRNTDFVFGKL